MKPAAFNYLSPAALPDALSLLHKLGDRAKILAGGQSLVPILNFRLGRHEYLIDVNRVPELAYIRTDKNTLCIGAMTRQRSIEVSDLVALHAPLLSEATQFVAHLPIRTRGTLGGSLVHADPAAEYPAVMLALDAEMVIASEAGTHHVGIDSFFKGPMETLVQPNEMLVEIPIPVRRPGQGFAFDEVSRRKGDFALIGAASSVTLNGGRIESARIAICGLESGACRMREAEDMLAGVEAGPQALGRAAKAAAASASAQDDIHATAGYRRHLVEVLTQRVLDRAILSAEASA